MSPHFDSNTGGKKRGESESQTAQFSPLSLSTSTSSSTFSHNFFYSLFLKTPTPVTKIKVANPVVDLDGDEMTR